MSWPAAMGTTARRASSWTGTRARTRTRRAVGPPTSRCWRRSSAARCPRCTRRSLDRLYRSMRTFLRLTDAARKHGVRIVTLREGVLGGDESPMAVGVRPDHGRILRAGAPHREGPRGGGAGRPARAGRPYRDGGLRLAPSTHPRTARSPGTPTARTSSRLTRTGPSSRSSPPCARPGASSAAASCSGPAASRRPMAARHRGARRCARIIERNAPGAPAVCRTARSPDRRARCAPSPNCLSATAASRHSRPAPHADPDPAGASSVGPSRLPLHTGEPARPRGARAAVGNRGVLLPWIRDEVERLRLPGDAVKPRDRQCGPPRRPGGPPRARQRYVRARPRRWRLDP